MSTLDVPPAAQVGPYLSALQPSALAGELGVDSNAAGGRLEIGGLVYARGLGVSGNTTVEYDVAGAGERFEAWAGIDAASEGGPVSFQVFADDVLAFDSGPLHHVAWAPTVNPNRPVGVRVPLAGVSRLRLVTRSPARGALLADWGEARLTGRGGPGPGRPGAARGGLAATPPLGWNPWNLCGTRIDEALLRAMADALVASGLREAGYEYLCLDDGWQGPRGDTWDRAKFPGGIAALADYVHARGLKLGLYSRPAWVAGQEQRVARAFADWGIDYLKYDFSDEDAEQTNARMIAALRATGRPIVFNICEWGKNRPWTWGGRVGAQSWRVTYDVVDQWYTPADSNRGIGLLKAADQAEALGAWAGPGGWNDPDMLVVGLRGAGHVPGGCTDREYRTQFSLWCLLAAPLVAACDLRRLDDATHAVLSNPEAIAIDQDALGVPAVRVRKLGDREVWQRPLQGGDLALGLLNRGEQPAVIAARWCDLGITGRYRVRDVWARANLCTSDAALECEVAPHELVLLRLSPARQRPQP